MSRCDADCGGIVCDDGGAAAAQRSAPRPAEGTAVDTISLEPVDDVVVTMLMDISYDGLMADAGPGRRARIDRLPTVPAPHFEKRRTFAGLLAEHGFSALVTARRGGASHTLLFDTGISPDGLALNAERLGVDVGAIEAVVLSHGHLDHSGGFPGLSRLRPGRSLPLAVHPLVWSQRRFAAALPDAFVPNAVGTTYTCAAAAGDPPASGGAAAR
jgi:7,8-dihydropterin-6-yl-methyl-4-(beta-D-ribofuranosyl)aminobenzene 5'-phosphate synthase